MNSGPNNKDAVKEKLDSTTSFQYCEGSVKAFRGSSPTLVISPLAPRISPLNIRSVPAERPAVTKGERKSEKLLKTSLMAPLRSSTYRSKFLL
jgi:hypothetical protein